MKTLRLILIAVFLLTALGSFGCEEKEVAFAIDADELRLYIANTELGRTLFRADSMIVPTPFQLPGDTTTWVDSVIDHNRSIGVDTSRSNGAGLADWGNLGMVREASLRVEDSYTVVRRAVNAPGIAPDTSLRMIYRYGFFLKLADDSWPYLGWDLFGYAGFSGNLPVTVPIAVFAPGGTPLGTFYGDNSQLTFTGQIKGVGFRFVEVRDLIAREGGTRFVVNVIPSVSADGAARHFMLTASYPDQIRTTAMTPVGNDEYVGEIVTPGTSPRLYNIIFIQSFVDSSGEFERGWCIPYRTP